MADGFNGTKHDDAANPPQYEEEQLQALNPPPSYDAAAKATPVTSSGGERVQYVPMGADGKALLVTEKGQVHVMIVTNQQVREVVILLSRAVCTFSD